MIDNKLDKIIQDMNYTLECLKVYRDFIMTGNCNICKLKSDCEYKPKLGELIRVNCPLYKENKE
jgi:hypothetical protein